MLVKSSRNWRRDVVLICVVGLISITGLYACAVTADHSSRQTKVAPVLPAGARGRSMPASEPLTGPSVDAIKASIRCLDKCNTTGIIGVQHAKWGRLRLVTAVQPFDGSIQSIVALVDAAGEVRWKKTSQELLDVRPASPATDRTGNYFVIYQTSRYHGVTILKPTSHGIETMQTFWGELGSQARFYYASPLGPWPRSGQYTIRMYEHSCSPDCASGATSHIDFRWNGSEYVEFNLDWWPRARL